MFKRGHQKRKNREHDNGFDEWGGYMNAKISKLEAQFKEEEKSVQEKDGKQSDIFKGVSIFVNGFTEPSAEELRCLMLQHGGIYHHYYRSGKTSHVIASSLPNAKFDQMKTMNVVKCEWITESIKAGRLLDYKNYLLVNNFPSGKIMRKNVLIENSITGLNTKNPEIPKTAADDGYLSDFYKNSRLHYISTLGAMLKQHVQDLRENHNGIFPGRARILETNTAPFLETLDESVIMHIDMDCFFVSVALRNRPHLIGQPVAVTHSKGRPPVDDRNTDRKFEVNFYRKKMKPKIQSNDDVSSSEDDADEWTREKSSMSEIASCSYEARQAGVKKGMYLGVALRLCPNLKTVPYDFDGYREVSLTLYSTIADYTLDIEAISCDELFIDCTYVLRDLKIDPMNFAQVLRNEILEKTKCTSSVGIGHNKLLARLATKHAKPNGQFFLTKDKIEDFMKNLMVSELPGVGRTINAKLKSLSVRTCEDLQNLSMACLKKEFGEKTGDALYKHCRGEDDRKVNYSHERKSVSAEVNYGIRFNDHEETETFLRKLSEEVSKRLKDIKMIGKNITFKVMYRAKDAPVETAKFLGHGACDVVNRSVALSAASDNPQVIAKHVIALYHQLGIPANELRGIGIQVTKLETLKKTPKTLQDFLHNQKTSTSAVHNKQVNLPTVKPPTASQIDPEVLASLPENIRQEILKEYGIKNLVVEQSTEEKKEPIPSQEDEEDDDSIKKLLGLSLEDMRTMIKEWVCRETRPRSYDVSMMKSYLSNLVEKRKLEVMTLVIKCLSRHIKNKRKDDEVWKETYEEIIDAVQSSMMRTFGKLLAQEVI